MSSISIPLTQGKYALIDEDDLPLVDHLNWYASVDQWGHAYAANTKLRVQMHRLIMQPCDGQIVDHINGDGLDNRRCNLRLADKSTNAANGRRHRDGSSRYKGVHYFKRDGRWTASIRKDNKQHRLGYFDTEEDAARVYDAKAVELFGEFALLNLPDRLGEPLPKRRTQRKAKGTEHDGGD